MAAVRGVDELRRHTNPAAGAPNTALEDRPHAEGIANPAALLQSGILMMRYLGEREAADKTESAMLRVFEEGKVRTRDIGGTARTAEFADAIIQKMKSKT